MNQNMWHLFFWVWLISFNIIISISNHVVQSDVVSLFHISIKLPVYLYPTFLPSPFFFSIFFSIPPVLLHWTTSQLQSSLSWNSPYSHWYWPHSNPPISGSQALGLQVWATTSVYSSLKNNPLITWFSFSNRYSIVNNVAEKKKQGSYFAFDKSMSFPLDTQSQGCWITWYLHHYVYKGTSTLFSTMATLTHIPTNSMQGFSSL